MWTASHWVQITMDQRNREAVNIIHRRRYLPQLLIVKANKQKSDIIQRELRTSFVLSADAFNSRYPRRVPRGARSMTSQNMLSASEHP